MKRFKFPFILLIPVLFLSSPGLTYASGISNVRVSSIYERSFTVSWTSDTSETGAVNFGVTNTLGTTAADTRGGNTNSSTHFVIIGNLVPSTKYYFSIRSGSTTDDNNGGFYTVTTGPVLSVPASDIAYGRVLKSDGTPLVGAIVYVSVSDVDRQGSSGQSLPLSALTNQTGGWTANLGNARVTDLSSYFAYSTGDRLNIQVSGGLAGASSTTVFVSASKPVADMTMGGTGQTTPTPTLPPGSTLTPVPSSTPMPTPTPLVSPDTGLTAPGSVMLFLSSSFIGLGFFVIFFPAFPPFRRFVRQRRKKSLEDKFGGV